MLVWNKGDIFAKLEYFILWHSWTKNYIYYWHFQALSTKLFFKKSINGTVFNKIVSKSGKV